VHLQVKLKSLRFVSSETTTLELALITWLLLQMKDLNVKSDPLVAAKSAIALAIPIVYVLKCTGESSNLVILLDELLSFFVSLVEVLILLVLNHRLILIKVEIIAVILIY